MHPIQTALLSFGMSGRVFHAPFISANPHFNLCAVWERSKKTAGETYPAIRSYSTLKALLHDQAVELVVVNTPNITHYEYAREALMAGKHVIVEKPFTVTVEEGEELIALAAEKKLFLSVYQNRRYDSDFRTVRKVVKEGWLGSVVEAEFHYDRFKAELSPKVHKEIPVTGTGGLYDLGAHLIDQALVLFGMPAALFADIDAFRPGSKVDDFFELILFYPDKRIRLHSTYLARESAPEYIVHGTLGSFLKSKTDVQEEALIAGNPPTGPDWGIEPEEQSGLLHTEKDGKVIRERVPSLRGNYADYYQEVYGALRKGGTNPVPGSEGLNVIRVIRAAYESREGRKVVELGAME
jgi:predicted dehydrogenase